MNLHKYFTPLPGDEVTTAVGHFNVFPLREKGIAPNHKVKNWSELAENFAGMDSMVIILNHARDIHNGFRPFDPKKHIAIAGMNIDNWKLPANAMEVVNSGALQSDPMLLFHDWFGMMNRGIILTPIGASDSHDVSRYLVGQARTYTKSSGNDNTTNSNEVMANFKKGSVMVSFGLLPKIVVNKKYGPGELVPRSNQIVLDIEVDGPGWINAERLSLYVNGVKTREQKIAKGNGSGIKWKGQWKLPNTKQDVFVVVIAEGAGRYLPYWPIVKPYQPVSKSWRPYTIGSSGAVWIDADGDGNRTSANTYAKKLLMDFKDDFKKLFKQLAEYDEAVAIQVAAILHERGIDIMNSSVTSALSQGSNATKEGFRKFSEALMSAKKDH
jgi:hypothetical protein